MYPLDYAVDYTPEELADIACELFMHDVYNSPPFEIILFLMPVLTIALSISKKEIRGLIPSFCIGLAIIVQTIIMLFKTRLFYGICTDPPFIVPPFSGFVYRALFSKLFICLALFFAIHYGFPVLKRHVQHKREISQYMKFKREQDKPEYRDSGN